MDAQDKLQALSEAVNPGAALETIPHGELVATAKRQRTEAARLKIKCDELEQTLRHQCKVIDENLDLMHRLRYAIPHDLQQPERPKHTAAAVEAATIRFDGTDRNSSRIDEGSPWRIRDAAGRSYRRVQWVNTLTGEIRHCQTGLSNYETTQAELPLDITDCDGRRYDEPSLISVSEVRLDPARGPWRLTTQTGTRLENVVSANTCTRRVTRINDLGQHEACNVRDRFRILDRDGISYRTPRETTGEAVPGPEPEAADPQAEPEPEWVLDFPASGWVNISGNEWRRLFEPPSHVAAARQFSEQMAERAGEAALRSITEQNDDATPREET